MSRVYADNVYPELVTEDLTLGAAGDSVVVTSGASLNVNTLKDSGGNTIFTSNGSGVLSSVNSAFQGKPSLITTNTSSGDASSDFTSGIDDTYKLYIFSMIDINPATDTTTFGFQGNASGQTGYNETITSTFFRAYRQDGGAGTALGYVTNSDQANGTGLQYINESGQLGSDNDESISGELYLFNPSSTTYVKHFWSRVQGKMQGGGDNYSVQAFMAGYFNVTAAITNIQFKMESGNMDGTIKMYGL